MSSPSITITSPRRRKDTSTIRTFQPDPLLVLYELKDRDRSRSGLRVIRVCVSMPRNFNAGFSGWVRAFSLRLSHARFAIETQLNPILRHPLYEWVRFGDRRRPWASTKARVCELSLQTRKAGAEHIEENLMRAKSGVKGKRLKKKEQKEEHKVLDGKEVFRLKILQEMSLHNFCFCKMGQTLQKMENIKIAEIRR